MITTLIRTSFFYFIIVALLGTVLRLNSVFQFSLPYTNILHAHSHIAFLGWIYTALFAFYFYLIQNNSDFQNQKTLKLQFYITQIANIGMVISFPLQGYGLFSISFSTLHILCSYWFAITFFKSINKIKVSKIVKQFGIAAIVFMLFSSLGPLSLGPIIKLKGHSSEWYFNCIYFYLHFQYNGWFTFSVFALLFYYYDIKNIPYNHKYAKRFYYTLFLACVPCYLLSVLWCNPILPIYIISISFAFIQLIAVVYLIAAIKKSFAIIKSFKKTFSGTLFQLAIVCFITKILLQFLSGFPYFAHLAYMQRALIIGYLHLCLLGFISPLLIFFSLELGFVKQTLRFKNSLKLYIIGFVLTEMVLFVYLGMAEIFELYFPFGNEMLFAASLILLFSSLSMFYSLKRI